MSNFEPWPKIPRAGKVGVTITEKMDGTNAQILIEDVSSEYKGIGPKLAIQAGSRNRWIAATDNARDDNFGFARWVDQNKELLLRLGPGRHFGEWYGEGIGRTYQLMCRNFALFDRQRFTPEELALRGLDVIGVQCVPILATCSIADLAGTMAYAELKLKANGSVLVPGYMRPEGFVAQIHGGPNFKVVFDNAQGQPKQREEFADRDMRKNGVRMLDGRYAGMTASDIADAFKAPSALPVDAS